jgi:hypothetical protein
MSEALAEKRFVHQPKWFSVIVSSAHLGAGRRGDHTICVEADNTIGALDKAKQYPGWKRGIRGSHVFPEIRELTEEEAQDLVQSIRGAGLSLPRAQEVGIDMRILQARRESDPQ